MNKALQNFWRYALMFCVSSFLLLQVGCACSSASCCSSACSKSSCSKTEEKQSCSKKSCAKAGCSKEENKKSCGESYTKTCCKK